MKISIKLLLVFLLISIVPLVIFGTITTKDVKDLSEETSIGLSSMQDSVVSQSNGAVTTLVGESFLREGHLIVSDILRTLDEREKDVRTLANMIETSPDINHTKKILVEFYKSNEQDIWFNSNTDLEPVEGRLTIPLYPTITYIDNNGMELLKLVDGKFSSDLKDVSDPSNTEFKSETYFSDTIENGFSISHVNTWYTTPDIAREGAPEGTKTYDVVPERDIKKSGNIKFSQKLSEGIVVLSYDYRHFQALTKHIDPASSTPSVSTSYEGNYILFYDDEGHTIVHPKPNNIRGYLDDGSLEHTNTVDTPGGIFNLKDYDKTETYQNIYKKTIVDQETYISSSTDLSGRNKMVIALPIPYDKGVYKESGAFGGIMMSVNTDIFYASVNTIEDEVSETVEGTRKEILSVLDNLNSKSMILIVITLAITILVGLFFSHRLTKPITELTRIGKTLADGDLTVDVPVIDTKDEVAELSHTIGLLVGSLKYHMKKLNEKKK